MATTTTTRSGDPGSNWIEQTVGQTPCSVAVSLSAKGQAQFEVKLAFESPDDMRVHVADQLHAIIEQVKLALAPHGIALAGAPTTSEGR